jgi:hypothetical protein
MFSATPDNFDPRSGSFRRWCDKVGLSPEKYGWMSSGMFSGSGEEG